MIRHGAAVACQLHRVLCQGLEGVLRPDLPNNYLAAQTTLHSLSRRAKALQEVPESVRRAKLLIRSFRSGLLLLRANPEYDSQTLLSRTFGRVQFAQMVSRFTNPLITLPVGWMLRHTSTDPEIERAVINASPFSRSGVSSVFMVPVVGWRSSIWQTRRPGTGYPLWQLTGFSDFSVVASGVYTHGSGVARGCLAKLLTLEQLFLMPAGGPARQRILAEWGDTAQLLFSLRARTRLWLLRQHDLQRSQVAPVPTAIRALHRFVMANGCREGNKLMLQFASGSRQRLFRKAIRPTGAENLLPKVAMTVG